MNFSIEQSKYWDIFKQQQRYSLKSPKVVNRYYSLM